MDGKSGRQHGAGAPAPTGQRGAAGRRGREAERPTDIPGLGWRDILGRLRRAMGRDHIWLASAAVAYCFLFAAIPGLFAAAALLGLLVDPATVQRQLGATSDLLPAEAGGFLAEQVRGNAAPRSPTPFGPRRRKLGLPARNDQAAEPSSSFLVGIDEG